MKPLSQEARTLVDSARVDAPSEAYRERMRQRLAVSLGGATAASTIAVTSKSAVAQTGMVKATGVALWVKAGTIIVGIAVLAGGAALLWPDSGRTQAAVPTQQSERAARPDATPKAPEALPAPIASPPNAAPGKEQNAAPGKEQNAAPGKEQNGSAPAPPARPQQTSALPPRVMGKAATVAPTKANNTVANNANALNQELMFLSRAQASLSAGDAARALALLDEHATTYPNGALREERMAARVFALCALGRQEEARAEAQQFVSMAPRSPLATRVRGACSMGESSPVKPL